MKQLKSFMVMNVSGMNRVTATYDEIGADGMPVSKNNKLSFYAVDEALTEGLDAVQKIIKARLEG